jgi:Protein of unknown function (DUF2783)
VTAHQGLTDEASELLHARLALILADRIGDPEVLREVLNLARAGLVPATETLSAPGPDRSRTVLESVRIATPKGWGWPKVSSQGPERQEATRA